MNTLLDLYRIYSPSGGEKPMKKYIKNWVKNNVQGCKITHDNKGNIYVTKGDSDTYPCIVSHIDQVQDKYSDDYNVYLLKDTLMGYSQKRREFEGLGADDKNGIWVCLKCLQKYDIMKCAFFVEEEIGCGGSSAAKIDWFDDCRFVLQCDRRGGSDLITNISWIDLCSDEFLQDINYSAYGYKPTSGLMTDVETLKNRGVNLSMLNISCGYYNPHTDNEFTVISELKNCLAFVENIIENCTDVYPHKHERRVYQPVKTNLLGSTYGGWYGDNYDDWRDWYDDDPIQSVGDVIAESRADLYDWQQEYDEVYDSVWMMLLEDNTRTADDIYNEYKSCLVCLELQDIEAMVEDIKNELMINEL